MTKRLRTHFVIRTSAFDILLILLSEVLGQMNEMNHG
jgi:hypothetical protein